MDWLLSAAQFLVNEVLSVPAFLIGIITAAGLAALRRPIGQVVGSALKATLGFLLSLRDAWLIGLVTGAIWVANIYQRKAGWMRFFIALIAGSGLSAVLRKMLA